MNCMLIIINDIVKIVNVLVLIVLRVLNNFGYVKEDIKKWIEVVIKEMNYILSVIVRSLFKSEINIIGVIVFDIINLYFGEIIKGISEVVEKNNLNIILFNIDNYLYKEVNVFKFFKE